MASAQRTEDTLYNALYGLFQQHYEELLVGFDSMEPLNVQTAENLQRVKEKTLMKQKLLEELTAEIVRMESNLAEPIWNSDAPHRLSSVLDKHTDAPRMICQKTNQHDLLPEFQLLYKEIREEAYRQDKKTDKTHN